MKEQITRTKFTCDNCRKETEELMKFPYSDSWVYLHLFEFKKQDYNNQNKKDKHFCSKECLKEFLNKEIEK